MALHEVLGGAGRDVAARETAADEIGGREGEVAALDALDDRLGQLQQPQRLARPRRRRADDPRHLGRRQRRILGHDQPRRARELHRLGLALMEVLGELHRQRLAPRDPLHEREAPVLARPLGLVDEPHRGQPALPGEQLVRLLVLARRAYQRRVQQAGLADRDRELVHVVKRAGAQVGHRPHLAHRRRDRALRLAGGIGHGRLAQVGAARLPQDASGLLAHLGDVFFGLLELIDRHQPRHASRRPGRRRARARRPRRRYGVVVESVNVSVLA